MTFFPEASGRSSAGFLMHAFCCLHCQSDLRATLAKLRAQKADLTQSVLLMEEMGQTQVVVDYNFQSAVDDPHGLIAHHAVTQATSYQNELNQHSGGQKHHRKALALPGKMKTLSLMQNPANNLTGF
ncbi:hypothetical protein ABIE64_003743 [Thalassospira sp. MBR-102]|uniref:hypothetical protein n=1 Tax=Thalassospira TaxID=168934 RepID=UPI00111351C3|nr:MULTISPECIES: hypothetical protein [Thalassospira]MDM7977540.1 hypothetical protein [Thalassospira xiamenensis]